MSIFRTTDSDITRITVGGRAIDVLNKAKWDSFQIDILGLGDIGLQSKVTSAICTIFDLEGFTFFCKQIDPQLAVPVFLKNYLSWFFERIRTETSEKEYPEGVSTWHELPFLIKFMGDGLMLLWDIKSLGMTGQMNIITSCHEIVESYAGQFYPRIKKMVSDAPRKLRCGIAKGNILSVGNGNDYVGPSINYASRMQKLPGVSIAFANRGFDPEHGWQKEIRKLWVEKQMKIRGIGDSELVYLLKEDFEQMEATDQALYTDP